jgi:hypothetical protein
VGDGRRGGPKDGLTSGAVVQICSLTLKHAQRAAAFARQVFMYETRCREASPALAGLRRRNVWAGRKFAFKFINAIEGSA